MQLRERYEGGRTDKDKARERPWQEAVGLDREMQRGDRLDRELAELDRPGDKPFTEIERLVKVWKEQKKVQGVEDSDTEKRTQVKVMPHDRYCLRYLMLQIQGNDNISRIWKPSKIDSMIPRQFQHRMSFVSESWKT